MTDTDKWKYAKFDGHGAYTLPDGSKYTGQWRYGKFNGQGTLYSYTWPNGSSKYTGEFKDGERVP